MYNSNIPTREDLPTVRELNRSSAIAACVAIVVLVGAVLPAEYGIDPTGIGRVIGLTQMGDIKRQLHEEAEADRLGAASTIETPEPPRSVLARIADELLVSTASAHDGGHDVAQPTAAAEETMAPAKAERRDEASVTLTPGEGAEIKLIMRKGAKVAYTWVVEGGTANFDLHGDNKGGASISYEKGRSVAGDEGILTAAFDGNHGWFWRNRTGQPVTVKLTVSGDYSDIKRLK